MSPSNGIVIANSSIDFAIDQWTWGIDWEYVLFSSFSSVAPLKQIQVYESHEAGFCKWSFQNH